VTALYESKIESVPEAVSPHPVTFTELTEHVSASRLTTFHSCRLKFLFRYALRISKPKPPTLHVGSVVHLMLKEWNRARWHRKEITNEALRAEFDQNWKDEQEFAKVDWEGEDEHKEKEVAWHLFQCYLAQTPIKPNEKLEAVEVTVEADLRKHGLTKLTGIIDLVRFKGRIVDFKTSGQTPNFDRAIHLHESQLACYAVLYRDATGEREQSLELHHLVKTKVPKLVVTPLGPMTDHQRTRLFRLIESYLNGIRNEDYVPNPNPMTCACCEYFKECRQWGGQPARQET
jgi:CRISPR/Cas system-associated exonuclease Cas4 (RecB family)